MDEVLLNADRSLFYFCNQDLRNWLFDAILPFLTDLNRKPLALVVVGLLWLLLLTKGGRHGRIAALLLIPTIVLSDQLSSSVLKYIIERARPCHELSNVHLLVGCGSGYSFPSSHAVNNFAGALVLSYFLPRWTWAFFTFASVIAFSRIYVGVHYPSDVLGGAVIGLFIAGIVIFVFRFAEEWWIGRRRIKAAGSK
ncbi:MAG TPA: phosphatase PAP2 family protein [Bacteroidota bacterium]|nr:phosphatase PAP2 family protein [Bacteroidota bacterium]